jgi:hypothetical protein
MITTEDDASIFVNLLNPKEPEFEIFNNTPTLIIVKEKLSGTLTIPAETKVPYIFTDLLSGKRELTVTIGSSTTKV